MVATPAELLDAVEDLRPALAHLDELMRGVARIEMSASDLPTARRLAFELSNRVPGLHALGLLLQTNAAERELLLAKLTQDAIVGDQLRAVLREFDRIPVLLRVMAAVHPYSFAVPGEAAWAAYRAWLRGLRDRPLWGLPAEVRVPLSSVYVPPDYTERVWKRPAREELVSLSETPEEAANDPRPRLREILVGDGRGEENLAFVVGGPGSGKSTLARMLASELADEPGVQPLLIRLREVHPERDLFGEIVRTLNDLDLPGEAGATLAGVFAWAPRLVLLLDGFDELIQAARTGLGSFFLRVRELLRDERVHAVVCFGRDTVFQSRETALPDGVRVFSLRPFREEQVAAWCAAWNRETGAQFNALAYGGSGNDREVMKSLVAEPLPLFLMAVLHREGKLPVGADASLDLAAVYRAVIHATCQRHQDERKSVSAAELRRFLRVLGFAVVQSGTELIRLPELARALRATGLSFDPVETESRATQLILAISHRRSDRDERAWEFIHRSLGEYLAAEFLAAEVPLMVAEEEDEFGERRFRMDEVALTRKWIERFGPTVVSVGVERFLVRMMGDWPAFGRGETAMDLDRDVNRLADRLGVVYRRLVDEDDAETVVAVARGWETVPSTVLMNAIRNVFVTVALPTPGRAEACFAPELAAPGRFMKAYWLGRLADVWRVGNANRSIELGGINPGASLHDLRFYSIRFTRCTVKDLFAFRARILPLQLEECSFEDAVFVGATINVATSRDVVFRRCDLSGSRWEFFEDGTRWRFHECHLSGSIFLRAPELDGYIRRYLDAGGRYIGPEIYSTPTDEDATGLVISG